MSEARIDDVLRVLRTIAAACAVSLVAYSAVAAVLWAMDRLPEPTVPEVLPLVLAGIGGLTLLMAWAVPPLAARASAGRDPLAGYRAGTIVALSMRETAGILGFVATLLSGQIAWVLAMCAIAVVAILVAWPTRIAAENAIDA